jgi:CSLREA domain-containing protein
MRRDTARTRLALLLLQLLPLFVAEAATIAVGTTADTDTSDGFCSLREAILAANTDTTYRECPAGSGADRIVFALAFPAAIDLVADLPPVTATVAIRGPGSDLLAIDGQDLYRLFYLRSPAGGAWYLLEDLSIQHGLADDALGVFGGGVYVGPGDNGVLSRVVVAENTAANGGGGIAVDGLVGLPAKAEVVESIVIGNRALAAAGGGGMLVLDASEVTVRASSFVGNSAEGTTGSGGGMAIQRGFVVLTRSTVSGNAAHRYGGGVHISASTDDAALTVVDSTITDNFADADVDLEGDGGGIQADGSSTTVLTLEIVNSIVAGNYDNGATVYPDFEVDSEVTLITSGFNLVGANDGAAADFPSGMPNPNGDFVGTAAMPLDPMLQLLDLNQGITLSHRPVLDPASPVIDHGSCPGSDGDQRGHGAAAFHRRALDHPVVPTHLASDGCDIGAVERGGNAKAPSALFLDGFELGHALRWSADAP